MKTDRQQIVNAAIRTAMGDRAEDVEPSRRMEDLIDWQMRSLVLRAPSAIFSLRPDGATVVVPIAYRGWRSLARCLFRLRRERRYALDRLSAEAVELFDGRRTLGEVVDEFGARHHLTFFEARGALLGFLHPLLRKGILLLVAPREGPLGGGAALGPAGGEPLTERAHRRAGKETR